MCLRDIFEWFRPRNYSQQDTVFESQPLSQNNILSSQVYRQQHPRLSKFLLDMFDMLVDQQGRTYQQYTVLAVYSLSDIYNLRDIVFECQPLSQNNSLSQWLYRRSHPRVSKFLQHMFDMLVDPRRRMCQQYTGLGVYSLLDIYNQQGTGFES
jgi:hypothetical protein